MQSAQRNTARRNDYSSLSTMVTSYVGNNNGNMPSKIKATWLNANGKDPDDEPYTETTVVDCTLSTNQTTDKECSVGDLGRNANQVYVIIGATCTNGTPKFKQGKRNFVVYGYIEDGANTDGTYCSASNA